MEQRYRDRRAPRPPRAPVSRGNVPPAVAGPLVVRFLEEDDTEYLVGEPEGSRTAWIPKRRAFTEPYSPERSIAASERLLRWSFYALIGVVCGGIVGIALGGLVVLAALVRLARLSGRIRRWRRHAKERQPSPMLSQSPQLPEEATRERMQLLAALGQGFLAILLGGAVLFVILTLR